MADFSTAFDSDLSDIEMPEVSTPESDTESAPVETVEAAAAPVAEEVETDIGETKEPVEQPVVSDPATPAKPAPRQLAFVDADGKPIQVLESAVTSWKVDGKPEKITVRDLLDNYSGKVSYDRKFNELSQQRKSLVDESSKFESDRRRHSALVNDMHTAVREGRTFDAVANLLEMTGNKDVNAEAYVAGLREAMIRQAQALAALSPEQRALKEAQEKADYSESKVKSMAQRRDQEQAEAAFRSRVDKAIEQSKSTVEEFVAKRKWLLERFKADGTDPKSITPEFIANHITELRDYQVARDTLTEVDPKLAGNEKFLDTAVKLMRDNPNWSPEDVKDIFRKAVSGRRAQSVSNKLGKAPVATVAKGAAKTRMVAAPGREPDDVTKAKYTADDLTW